MTSQRLARLMSPFLELSGLRGRRMLPGMGEPGSTKYARTLADLERSVHMPWDQQVAEQAEPPSPGPIAPEELDRQRLLGITGAGRLRQR